MDRQLTEDNFDDVARQAGDALRRQAPADGMIRIRQTRRRQQQVRTATGVTAVAAIIAIGAFVATRNDDEPALVIQPESTVATLPAPTTTPSSTTVAPAPTTTVPPATTPSTTAPNPSVPNASVPPVEPVSAATQAWIADQVAAGFTQIDVAPGQGTTARRLTAQDVDFQVRIAVLLDDGRVVDAPDGVPVGELYGVGGRPAFVQLGFEDTPDPATQVWVLDPTNDTWASTGDLGIGGLRTNTTILSETVRVVDDVLVVANDAFDAVDEFTVTPSPDRRGVVVRADLSVTPMATPPDGVALFFTSAAGGKALQLYAPNMGSLGTDLAYDQPWQYDPLANEWSEIPIPGWMNCGDAVDCTWSTGYDIGSIELEVPVGRGVVALVPDGTVGFYDPADGVWTRFDDAPFQLAMPTVAVVGQQVVVAPWRTFDGDFTTIGVLDVASGGWTTQQIDIPADIEARMSTEWSDVSWDIRAAGSRVMAVPGRSFQQSDEDPIAVYDALSRTWGEPTDEDIRAWNAAATRLG